MPEPKCSGNKMKILLTNDDGFDAVGLRELDSVLSRAGHEVWVCAPSGQRSASSHAIHLHSPVEVKKLSERHYACSGFPADCVLYAVMGAVPMGRPDVVISGINNGYNVSTDLVYSGTAGAAAEGCVRGYAAIAVSCAGNAFPDAAAFTLKYLETFTEICPPGCYININVPEGSKGRWTVCTLGDVSYSDRLEEHSVADHYIITGVEKPFMTEPYDRKTDYSAVNDSRTIAVSAVRIIPQVDPACQKELEKLCQLDGAISFC